MHTTKQPHPQTVSARAWLIWATGLSFVLFQFTLQLSSGVLIEQLAISFSLSAFHAGILSASYYYIYVVLQIPAGILADRFGARLILALGSFACAGGCYLFAYAQSLMMAELGRLLMGGGGALSFVGVLFLVQHWFPVKRFAMMVGLTEMVGLLSTVCGNFYLAEFVTELGWRFTMKAAGFLSLLIAAFCWLVVRDTPDNSRYAISIDKDAFMQQCKNMLKDRNIWLNGIYCGLLYTLITVFVALWGVPFIMLKYSVSLQTSTAVNITLFGGAAVACPIVGWAAQRFDCYRFFLLLGAFAPAILITLIIYTTPPLLGMAALMFCAGLCVSPYVLNFALANRCAPPSTASTYIGFINGLCMVTAPLFQMLIGKLLDISYAVRSSNEVIVGQYTLTDYHFALAIFPVLLLCAGVIAFFIQVRAPSAEKAPPQIEPNLTPEATPPMVNG